MRKIVLIFIVILFSICTLTACNNVKNESFDEKINKLKLSGTLITYQAYFHQVLEHDKKAGTGIAHVLEKDRKLFAEYTGTIKYGIDLSKVEVKRAGNTINVFIPKAKVIGEPNVDKEDFKSESFIESSDRFINSNPITGDDISDAFDEAQQKMKEKAEKDEELLSLAQKRAKVLLEENLSQFSGITSKTYDIDWEYE